jgi:hypothetical protein
MLTQPSSQLTSQLLTQNSIAALLSQWCCRTHWERHYRAYDLAVEFWATGLWVRQAGLISYRDWANFLIYSTNIRAGGLQVQQVSRTIYLVQGTQQPWYAVHRPHPQQPLRCECLLYRNRAKRLPQELPQLFDRLGRAFCHHTAAVECIRFV